jgi:hypothetical protein
MREVLAMITIEIRKAIMVYSMAVVPLWQSQNVFTKDRAAWE